VLITVDNIIERHQYLNVRSTFKALFDYDCIPIGAPVHVHHRGLRQ
jgi:glutamate 5-kinase